MTQAERLPAAGSTGERLRALVRHAVLAPSSHNTQPWRFRVTGDSLELRADPARRLPHVDPHDRELVISCGAALEHLCVAARYFGATPVVELCPSADEPGLLARLRLGDAHASAPEDDALFAGMAHRHTWRRPFEPRPLPSALLARLAAAAEAAGGHLEFVEAPGQRAALAELIMEGDRRQMAHPGFRHELAEWLRPSDRAAPDGIPGEALAIGALTARLAPLVVRTFDLGHGQAAKDRDLTLDSPTLAVLATPEDTRRDWLRAGRALARVLLLACDAGVRASFLNQPIEVATLRPRLAALLGTPRAPQLLLRLGFAPEGRPTPRRPVEDVLD
ncbi:MAG TPA: nitroreductase family protein [Gemmatimonadales bacterium]|nr:nitroreductase family protein [Gemmatimonadales bacterium]